MATFDVPDQRQNFIVEAFQAKAAIGSSLTVVDTPGIVKGSHQVYRALISLKMHHVEYYFS